MAAQELSKSTRSRLASMKQTPLKHHVINTHINATKR